MTQQCSNFQIKNATKYYIIENKQNSEKNSQDKLLLLLL